jgi:hypothetical protein
MPVNKIREYSKKQVKEGIGMLINREEINKHKFFPGIDKVLEEYLIQNPTKKSE